MGLGLLILVLLVADWISLFLLHDALERTLDVGPFTALGLLFLWLAVAVGLGFFVMTVGGYREVLKGWRSAARLQSPDKHLLDATLMAGAGLLLIIPGVISDALALILIFPLTRAILRPLVRRKAVVRVNGHTFGGPGAQRRTSPPPPGDEESGGTFDVDDYRIE